MTQFMIKGPFPHNEYAAVQVQIVYQKHAPWCVSRIAAISETKHCTYEQTTVQTDCHQLFWPIEYLLLVYFLLAGSEKGTVKLNEYCQVSTTTLSYISLFVVML